MIRSSLCDYEDVCILVNGTIAAITGHARESARRTEAQIQTARQNN